MNKRALLLLTFLFPLAVHASIFVDTAAHPHEQYIERLGELGIVSGYGYGIFRPDIAINRAEFLKIVMSAAFGNEVNNVENVYCFSDFRGAEQWYWKYACTAKNRGIISGYPDGSFRGEQTVNLAEALKIATRSWDIDTTSAINYAPEFWYMPYFDIAAARGIFADLPRDGGYLLTRSDMAYLIVALDVPLKDVTGSTSSSSSSSTAAGVCGNGVKEGKEQCDDGNTLNDDGCSAICVIVDQPVRHGALRVDQRPVAASSLAAGAKNVTVFAMDAVAGRQDVQLTVLSFVTQSGSLTSATNYRMFYDSNGDGLADKQAGTATAQNNTLSFNNLAIPVKDGYATRLELKADITTTPASGAWSIGFNTANARFVQAIGTQDNRDLTGIELNGADCAESSICWIAVSTIANPVFHIIDQGSLYITSSSSQAPSSQVLGSRTSSDLLRIKLRADGEDIKVTRFNFTGVSDSFSRLLLYKQGEEFPFETAWTTECANVGNGKFCSIASFTVQDQQEVTLLVRGVAKADTEGGTSGGSATITLESTSSLLGVEAQGVESQDVLVKNDGDNFAEGEVFIGRSTPGTDTTITSNPHDLVLAKLTNIENANPDADNASVPTGTTAFGVFKFYAASHDNTNGGSNDVNIRKLVFTVNANNVQFQSNSFEIYNTANASVTTACTSSATTGVFTVTCDNLQSASVNTEVEAGQNITLALRGVITNPQIAAGSSSLQASLNDLTNRASGGPVQWDDEITTMNWVDMLQTVIRSTSYKK